VDRDVDLPGDLSAPGLDAAAMRRVYALGGLQESEVAADPFEQFRRWFDDAVAAGLPEPNAMVLATSSPDGVPSARTVLLKGADASGFVFYTNRGSAKGRDLAANPRAALVFPWHPLERQVRVTGVVQEIDDEDVARYFATRPRESQLGAWASEQSAVIEGREVLEDAFAAAAQRWPEGATPPPPPSWGGYRVVPDQVEFWQGRSGRMHDRLRYRLTGDGWALERLAP
jgi:pyridoxamine 5'-phosphate oxidase